MNASSALCVTWHCVLRCRDNAAVSVLCKHVQRGDDFILPAVCVCGCVCVFLVMLCNLRCCSAADRGRRCRSASAINLKHPDLSWREERRISDFILCDVKLHCAAHVHCQCVQDEDGITLWTKPFKSFPSDVCVVQTSNHQEIISLSVRMKPVNDLCQSQ